MVTFLRYPYLKLTVTFALDVSGGDVPALLYRKLTVTFALVSGGDYPALSVSEASLHTQVEETERAGVP